MLSFSTLPLFLILAKVVFCHPKESVSIAIGSIKQARSEREYWIVRSSSRISSFLQLIRKKTRPDKDSNYQVWLNQHYLNPDGATENVPVAETPLVVTLKFKSRFDNSRYMITCPNAWYWPKDAEKRSGDFYVATVKVVNMGKTVLDVIDPSQICLYENMSHGGTHHGFSRSLPSQSPNYINRGRTAS